ncbi:MAG: formate transporter FocA [Planctomycetota bacterium]
MTKQNSAALPANNGLAPSLDAFLPNEMARKAENVGVKKANLPLDKMFLLAVLAGAFIAMGAIFATTVSTGAADLPLGVGRLLTGIAFSLGLILVVIAGAELFTGNNLVVMAMANRKISWSLMLKSWAVVYAGNFVGSLATAIILFLSGQWKQGGGAIGVKALEIANAKCSFGFVEAFFLGVLCNALVCLAIWLCFSARTTTDKILAIVPPITAFVAAGFEHSIANMYFVPAGMLIKSFGGEAFFGSATMGTTELANLTWFGFLVNNLLPVTLGNIVGGSLLVGVVYWFIHLRGTTEE